MENKSCLCCLCLVGTILTVIGVALSFASLDVNTYGLDYSPITKTIGENPLTSGFHFLGFMHSFVVYPATFQTFEFSDGEGANRPQIAARSKDGLMVNFRAQFQYQLRMEDLLKLYLTYGSDYKTPCLRFAIDKMNDIAAKYKANEFFKDLQNIQNAMDLELKTLFDKECYSNVQSVQLSSADLPQRFEDALLATNQAIQEKVTVLQTQENIKIDMQTKMKNAVISAPIMKINAKAKIDALIQTNQALMNSYVSVTKSESIAYQTLKENLQISNDEHLLDFIKVKTIGKYNQKNLIVAMEDLNADKNT